MKKICFTLALLLCCGSAFAFNPVVGDITTGFSRDDRLGVVKDYIYKLMWQDGDLSPHEMTHDEAVHYCENLNFAGFDNWRLPTIKELRSISDKSKFNPAINNIFKNTAYTKSDNSEIKYGLYWSSTTGYARDSSKWFVLDFETSNEYWAFLFSRYYVRCVLEY